MEDCLTPFKKSLKKIIGFVTILIVLVIFSGCTKELKSDVVVCHLDDYSLYPKVLGQILPNFTIEQLENKAYYTLDNGAITEAFDTQAIGALETGMVKYWYPQYLATVIIAIDRDQTEKVIIGWNDLLDTQLEVGFSDIDGNIQMLTAAMAYGLEGEAFTLTKSIELLRLLEEQKCLKINSVEAPLIICYDYQAVALIEKGRNLQIVIPKEGTLTYEKGLLSKKLLSFNGNVDQLLLKSKFRLIDGESNFSKYPKEKAYEPAVKVVDYNHFAKTTQYVRSLFEREVLDFHEYMSIDQREHLFFALLYIIIVTIWVTSVIRRSMQKGVTVAAFSTGIILIGWILVRLIRYQVIGALDLSRYLWYSYYIFQLSLPLVLLWLAWAVDRPENDTIPPKWWRGLAIFIGLLIIFVYTNDLHGLIFILDLNKWDWDINYSYGVGYYIVLFVCMANLIAVFAILIYKSMRNPRKIRFVFPIMILFIFASYNYHYIVRDPFAYKTDITIVTGFFAIFLYESCIRSGLIPVNTKYIDIFTRSPLKLQIINQKQEVVFACASAVSINKKIIEKAVVSSPIPILQKVDSLLFVTPIPGGYALYQEDIHKIIQLNKEIQESMKRLSDANIILAEEEKLERLVNENSIKKELMEQLENEINESVKQLSMMIERLPSTENYSLEMTRIALLLCYIKRRCNLFFKEKETNITDVDPLIVYIKELSEIVNYSNVQIATINEINESFPMRQATLFYDFFYGMVDLAISKGCSYIILHLGIEETIITMGLLPSEDIGIFEPGAKFMSAIDAAKGKIVRKELDDTTGTSLSFPRGGGICD